MNSLQTRLLLTVGLIAICAAIAVGLATRRDTRREFLRYQDVERRAAAFDVRERGRAVTAILDGRCCAPDILAQAQATLPPTHRILVLDASGTRLLAASTRTNDEVAFVSARVDGDVLSIDATRDDGARREQLVLQIKSGGERVRLAGGGDAVMHLMPVPDPARTARAEAFLGALDRRLIGLTAGVSLVALALTWLVARGTVRPLAALGDAAGALAAGQYDRRVQVAGPREVTALAERFNDLATRLEEQHVLRRALTNDVAHELRTPLTALQCRLESVIDGVASDPVGTCRALHDDVRHLTRLVDDLQDVALAEAGELRLTVAPIAVRGAVLEALRASGLDEGDGVEVLVDDDSYVCADAVRLRQVLVNVVGNARRHAPPTASIRVTARADSRLVRLEVENSGSHIEPEHLPHLFDRFYRVDPSRQRDTGGTGLGLAIVKHLVEAQGGTVWARSIDDTVTVGVSLPRCEPGAKADASSAFA